MKSNRKGFTLIELLVVVLIIGILASIALPQYFKVVEKSRISEANNTFASIAQAEERALARNGFYTNSWDTLDLTFRNASTNQPCTGGDTCPLKFFTYKIELTEAAQDEFSVTATRNSTPKAPSRYNENYIITFSIPGATLECSDDNCTTDLIETEAASGT